MGSTNRALTSDDQDLATSLVHHCLSPLDDRHRDEPRLAQRRRDVGHDFVQVSTNRVAEEVEIDVCGVE